MKTILKRATLFFGIGWSVAALAAPTTIDQAPMAAATTSVKPNIEFILDDSGSMCWQVMPDDAAFGGGVGGAYKSVAGNCSDSGPGSFGAGSAKYGPYSAHCNAVYYDPSKPSYALPIGSNNASFPAEAIVPTTVGSKVHGRIHQDGFYSYTGGGFTATTDFIEHVATGSGAALFPSPAATVGGTVTLNVDACPAGLKNDNVGNYQTAMMVYVAAEAPAFLGAHRIFGVYQSCAANVLSMKVTAVAGGAYSTARSNWRVAKIPGTYDYLGAEPDIGFTYSAAGALDTLTTFYTQCNAKTNSTPALFTFTPVTDLQNYANWYSYYRSRINTMKTSMSLAFGGMLDPDKYRLGYTTINYSGTSNADYRYLDIGDYCDATTNCTQRQNLFNKIFSAKAGGSTALRNALSKAGLLYAGKLLTGARDPVQYSCQKNYAILSTDGYWNAGSGWPAADVGGYRITPGACVGNACYALTAVGDQDGPTKTDFPAYDPPYTPVAIDEPQVDRSGGAGTPNYLADVAMYYYKTKLRDGALANCTSGSTGDDLCYLPPPPEPGPVPVSAKDCNRFQHMNTYTIGLGVEGHLRQADLYLTGGSADYNAVVAGTKNWPTASNATTIDDLWHAAVNGRGEYYSAKSPTAIVSSLNKALASIAAQSGSGGAAGASSAQLASGDAYAYLARYSPETWWGDVLALGLNPDTGALLNSAGSATSVCSALAAAAGPLPPPIWSAREQLDLLQTAKPSMGINERKIYMVVGGALTDFISANLPSPPSPEFDPTTLTQYAAMSADDKAQATKDNLVAYLRGVKSVTVGAGPAAGLCCEDQSGNKYRLFRDRAHVLGDIVGTEPNFVGKSIFYGDTGHATFSTNVTATRQRVVYAGGNDGMLHAFDAGMPGVPPAPPTPGTGDELWAFVPTAVLPNLKKLADFNFDSNHRYSVNGPMHVGDIQHGNTGQWTTLLVGGLGAGGRDYYALDVTNPGSPSLAWEFRTKNPAYADKMGYTFGAPLITKIKGGAAHNGKWVVLLPSGYNNESPGDMKGRLFVVDAHTGVVIYDIQTGTAADSSKSGLAGLANWVDSTLVDNSTQHVYGGDLDGNLWRFDISNGTVTQLAYFQKGGFRQPITHRPELGEVAFGALKQRVIFVGTGKTLTAGDLDPTVPGSTATRVQSFYAVKDDLATTFTASAFSSVGGVVALNLVSAAGARQLDYLPVASGAPGWYFDFDVDSGEKMTSDVTLQVGRLTFATTAPSMAATPCDSNLKSYVYFVEYNPQTTRSSKPWEISFMGDSAAFGASVHQTTSGSTVAAVTDSKGEFKIIENQDSQGGDTVRRVSWRELVK